jgi:Na+/citrate or Na+/malate symporter
LLEVPQIDQRLAVDHPQHALVAVSRRTHRSRCRSRTSIDSVTFSGILLRGSCLVKLPTGEGHLAGVIDLKIRIEPIEVAWLLTSTARRGGGDRRLMTAAARLQLLEFFQVLDRR